MDSPPSSVRRDGCSRIFRLCDAGGNRTPWTRLVFLRGEGGRECIGHREWRSRSLHGFEHSPQTKPLGILEGGWVRARRRREKVDSERTRDKYKEKRFFITSPTMTSLPFCLFVVAQFSQIVFQYHTVPWLPPSKPRDSKSQKSRRSREDTNTKCSSKLS